MNKKWILCILLVIICSMFCLNIVSADTVGENIEYDNYDESGLVSCGNQMLTDIPKILPEVVSIIYSVIQVVIPVVLVIFGSLDLMKGIAAQKDDDIKKGQQLLIKRLIAAVLVFFVFVVVKLLISVVADNYDDDNKVNDIIKCAECFIDNNCVKQVIN